MSACSTLGWTRICAGDWRNPATPMQPLRPRTRPQPERPALDLAAEERAAYKVQPPARRPEPEERSNDAARQDPTVQTRPATAPSPAQPPGEPQDALFQPPAPETLSLQDAALALHASLPDGQKVRREPLLHEAARRLGHQKLTKRVRSTLNKALNAEHNAGRLKTDWQLVWKPRNK